MTNLDVIFNKLAKNFSYQWWSLTKEERSQVANTLREGINYHCEAFEIIEDCVDLNMEIIKCMFVNEEQFEKSKEMMKNFVLKDEEVVESKRLYYKELEKIQKGEHLGYTKEAIFSMCLQFAQEDEYIFGVDSSKITKYINKLTDSIEKEQNVETKKDLIMKTLEYCAMVKYLNRASYYKEFKAELENAFSEDLKYFDEPHFMA